MIKCEQARDVCIARERALRLASTACGLYCKKKGEGRHLRLDGELALREVRVLLLGLKELLGGLALGETAANSSGLLDAEIKRLVSGLLERNPELSLLGLIDDSQDAGNRLADFGAIRRRLELAYPT